MNRWEKEEEALTRAYQSVSSEARLAVNAVSRKWGRAVATEKERADKAVLIGKIISGIAGVAIGTLAYLGYLEFTSILH